MWLEPQSCNQLDVGKEFSCTDLIVRLRLGCAHFSQTKNLAYHYKFKNGPILMENPTQECELFQAKPCLFPSGAAVGIKN